MVLECVVLFRLKNMFSMTLQLSFSSSETEKVCVCVCVCVCLSTTEVIKKKLCHWRDSFEGIMV